MPVFELIQYDIIAAAICGLIGGIAAELIDNKGSLGIFGYEKDDKGANTNKYNLGFIAKMIIGAAAALAFLFLIDTSDPLKFVGAAVAAGFGGSVTLVAVREKILGGQKDSLMQQQTDNARQLGTEHKAQVDSTATRMNPPGTIDNVDTVLKSVDSTYERYKNLT